MTSPQKAIIRALLYFDIFRHPLEMSELYEMSGTRTEKENFEKEVSDLLQKKWIDQDSGFYFLTNGHSPVPERMIRLKKSGKYYRIAKFMSFLIALHPFVRGVMISGSLSKRSFTTKDDIDFFIIAQPGRIWICKTLLMIFKKIFLLNSKKFFCINYIIDTNSLEISERNIFTATELAFLIPMRNPDLCRHFLDQNQWIRRYFPNHSLKLNGCVPIKKYFVKALFEKILNGKTGDRLDNFCMNLYRNRAMKKFADKDPDHFNINFRNEKNISKYHPKGFQTQIMNSFSEKIMEFEVKHQLDLNL